MAVDRNLYRMACDLLAFQMLFDIAVHHISKYIGKSRQVMFSSDHSEMFATNHSTFQWNCLPTFSALRNSSGSRRMRPLSVRMVFFYSTALSATCHAQVLVGFLSSSFLWLQSIRWLWSDKSDLIRTPRKDQAWNERLSECLSKFEHFLT